MMAFPTDHSTKIPKAKRAAFQLGPTSFPLYRLHTGLPKCSCFPLFGSSGVFQTAQTRTFCLSLTLSFSRMKNPPPIPSTQFRGQFFVAAFASVHLFFSFRFLPFLAGPPGKWLHLEYTFGHVVLGVRCGAGWGPQNTQGCAEVACCASEFTNCTTYDQAR